MTLFFFALRRKEFKLLAMDILFWVLTALILLVLLWVVFLLSFQFVFILCGFLKPKVFPKAKVLRKFAIIIPAHNESSVIGDSVKYLLHELDYPKDLYDVYVCADNCTDDTFALAEQAGAKVYERHCDDPDKKRAAFPIKLLIDEVMKSDKGYDAVIKFDADNIPSRNYLHAMNNALESGVSIARAHEAPSNMGQNLWTSVSACYYARDSRLACNFRERVNWNSMLSGAGMMVSLAVLKDTGGWDAMGGIDDAEFTVKRLLEGRHVNYVSDAIVYEDQPSSRADSAARNARMANGLAKLYKQSAWDLLKMFFKTGNLSYLDMFAQLSFVPLPMVLGISIPLYAVFFFLTLGLDAGGINVYSMFTPGWDGSAFSTMAWVLIGGLIALVFYYVLWTYQSWLGVYLDRDILDKDWYKQAKKGIWLGAIAMIVYGSSVSSGTRKKRVAWKEIKRNKK